MRTRQRDRDVPGPRSPWNQIRLGLWMGGHYYTDESGELQFAVVADQFDMVVSLYSKDGHGPAMGVEHHVATMPDGPLNASQIARVQELAAVTAQAITNGRNVLVRCHAGYNRSGLVAAQALIHLGYDARSAILLIRRKRSPWALHNRTFELYLETGLDLAHLLVGLES